MARCRVCAFPTGVIAPVTVCPAGVLYIVVARGGQYDATLEVQISYHVRKFDVVLEGHNKFCLGCSNFSSEGVVCCSEIRNRSAITSRSGGKAGDGVHHFLLVKMIS